MIIYYFINLAEIKYRIRFTKKMNSNMRKIEIKNLTTKEWKHKFKGKVGM